MADQSSEVLWKASEGVISSLEMISSFIWYEERDLP